MENLFTFDRTPQTSLLTDPPSQTVYLPTETSHQKTGKTPITTRPFAKTARKNKRKKGKGKFAGPRKANYGYVYPNPVPASTDIDWRGKPPSLSDFEDSEDELIRDYIANLDESESVDAPQDFQVLDTVQKKKDAWPLSQLASLDLGIGGFSDSEVSEMGQLNNESDANEDEIVINPLEVSLGGSRLPETGILEQLTETLDHEALEYLYDHSDSDESSIKIVFNIGNGEMDGDADNKEMFSGGNSKWTKTHLKVEQNSNSISRFNSVHNGEFPTKSSVSASDDDSGFLKFDNNKPLSKSARRKHAKQERKCKNDKDYEFKQALKEEQTRIASKIVKKKAGDAIDSEIAHILHRINKTIHDFILIDTDLQSLSLPPMPSALRTLAKQIASCYNIVPKTRGSGSNKAIVVNRTKTSRVPQEWQSIVGNVVSKGNNAVLRGNTWSGTKKGNGKKKKGPPGAPDDRTAPRPGDVVGDGAAPISEDNLGHRMMLSMGWSPGKSLGVQQENNASLLQDSSLDNALSEEIGASGSGSGLGLGYRLMEPIEVTVRAKRRGLGAE